MCMQPVRYAEPIQQSNPSSVETKSASMTLKPSIVQTTTSVVAILSIVAYLGNVVPVSRQFSKSSCFSCIFLLAFLFNIPLNLISTEKITLFLKRWKNDSATNGKKVFKSISGASSSEALSRLARVSSTDTFRKLSKSICNSLHSYNQRAALQAITRKECFARLSYIEQLSIDDLIILFRYATEINQPDFEKARFMSEQSRLVRAMATAIDMAVSISRGSYAEQVKLPGARKKGDIDALYFVAVTRIFAEWRNIRLVPEGYKRYSMSLGLAYRDVLQNLVKIELGVHSYIRSKTLQGSGGSKCKASSIPSPTLRELLDYERSTGVHPNLPRLTEKSAASGLLWAKRQMHYQTSTFANSLHVPTQFATPMDAGTAAYHEVYGDYHGWAVKKVFSHSLGGSPPIDQIWKVMDPPVRPDDDRPGDGKADFIMRKLSDVSEETIEGHDDEDEEVPENELLLELENLGRHIGERWEDLLRYFRCVATEKPSHQSNNLLIPTENYHVMITKLDRAALRALDASMKDLSSNNADSSSRSKDNGTSANDPIQAARSGAANFVKEVRPLITDISDLIEELNMNDPSKV